MATLIISTAHLDVERAISRARIARLVQLVADDAFRACPVIEAEASELLRRGAVNRPCRERSVEHDGDHKAAGD